jgi:hypothetical protein
LSSLTSARRLSFSASRFFILLTFSLRLLIFHATPTD